MSNKGIETSFSKSDNSLLFYKRLLIVVVTIIIIIFCALGIVLFTLSNKASIILGFVVIIVGLLLSWIVYQTSIFFLWLAYDLKMIRTKAYDVNISNALKVFAGQENDNFNYVEHKKVDNDIDNIVPNGKYRGQTNIKQIVVGSGKIKIGYTAFEDCSNLETITIPQTISEICAEAFKGCKQLVDIKYMGTKEQWDKIIKGYDWDLSTGNYSIHCLDGDIEKETNEQ